MGYAEEVIETLERQVERFLSVRDLALKQGTLIGQEDLSPLVSSVKETERLIGEIRADEARLRPLREGRAGATAQSGDGGRADVLAEVLRRVVREVQEIKQRNEALLLQAMEEVRKEMRQLYVGSKVMKNYRKGSPNTARFFDDAR